MKRWLALLMLLAVLFTGCGRKQNEIRAAICLRQCTDSLAAEQLDVLRTHLENAGYTVAVADGQADQSRQTGQIEALLEEGYDLLVVEPVMLELAGSIAQMGMEADVPIIFLGYEPEAAVLDSWEKLCYVGNRPEQAGSVQAQLLQQGDLNGDGIVTYAVIAGPEEDLDARIITSSVTDTATGECLEVCSTDWSKESACNRCGKLLSDYGKDLEVILCHSDTLAMGAKEAITDGGRTVGKDIYLAGVGGDVQSRLLIRSGDLSGTVYLPAEELAAKVTQAAGKLLRNEATEKQLYIDYVLLTKDNVENYIQNNVQ